MGDPRFFATPEAVSLADIASLTGAELRGYLLNDRTFQRFAGDKAPPLFYLGRDGVAARSFDDQTAELQRIVRRYGLDYAACFRMPTEM